LVGQARRLGHGKETDTDKDTERRKGYLLSITKKPIFELSLVTVYRMAEVCKVKNLPK